MAFRSAELKSEWDALKHSAPKHHALEITEDGLMLGAGTVLVRMTRDRFGAPMLDLTGSKDRILALLALAYERKIPVAVLGHMERAAKHWMQGERGLAQIHLAFARLPQLHDEKAMCRLFLGDRLIAGGTAPRALMKALGLDRAPEVEKFNPYQPRVPAGSGRESGQWTSGGTEGGQGNAGANSKTRSATAVENNDGKWTQLIAQTRFKFDPDSAVPRIEDIEGDVNPSNFANAFATATSSNQFVTVGDGSFGAIAKSAEATVSGNTLFSTGSVMAFDGSHVVTLSPSIEDQGLIVSLNKDHTIIVIQSKQEKP